MPKENTRVKGIFQIQLTSPSFAHWNSVASLTLNLLNRKGRQTQNVSLLNHKLTLSFSSFLCKRFSYYIGTRQSNPLTILSVGTGRIKGDVTRDDSQQRFLAQHCIATLLRHIVLNSYNIVPTLQRCVALKIVVANRLV